MTNEKSPVLAGTSNPGLMQNARVDSIKVPSKRERVLQALVSGRTYNRFEAERELADHCLHTTVSELQDKGLKIDRHEETVPGYMGLATRVKRYWLAPESREAALRLLDDFRRVRRSKRLQEAS